MWMVVWGRATDVPPSERQVTIFDALTGEFIRSGGIGDDSWSRLVDLAP
jgi:hypothetical protein